MTTQEVVSHFQPRYNFFDRNLLYYFVKQGYINFTPVRPPGRTLPVREFSDAEVVKIEALLEKYRQKREAENRQAETLKNLATSATGQPDHRPSILIVEDVDMHVELMLDELEREFKVDVAKSTDQARAALERMTVYDAIIIDLALPAAPGGPFVLMSGLDIIQTARARGVKCVIVQSSRISSDVEARLNEAGVLQIKKPSRPGALAGILREALTNSTTPP